jgi:cation:H+ antiporter
MCCFVMISPLGLSLLEPVENPIWVLLIGFAIGAVVVWVCGTKLSQWADVIARRTGMGRAFAGVLLLAWATSLPEVATTMTAGIVGNAALAGNNLLGGIAMQCWRRWTPWCCAAAR